MNSIEWNIAYKILDRYFNDFRNWEIAKERAFYDEFAEITELVDFTDDEFEWFINADEQKYDYNFWCSIIKRAWEIRANEVK